LGVGVVPIGKHFPGYGDLEADSDHALATADWPKAKVLEQTRAFDDAATSLAGVMLSNLVYSAYGPRPAILSAPLVAMAHQHEWLAVTDDIAIKVLADAIGGSSEDVLKAALMAGNDILLTTAPPDWDRGLDYLGLLSAFAEENPNARLQVDVSCRRVLRLKDRMGLLDGL
jgi:beta-N-acetylhexosaminidase